LVVLASVSHGGGNYVQPDGTAYGGATDIRAFSGVVLLPEAWSKNPVKVK
jgi:hypothetical protein